MEENIMNVITSHKFYSKKRIMNMFCIFVLFFFINSGYLSGVRIGMRTITAILVVLFLALLFMKTGGRIRLDRNLSTDAVRKMLCFQFFLLIYSAVLYVTIGIDDVQSIGSGKHIFVLVRNFLLLVPLFYLGFIYLHSSLDHLMSNLLLVSCLQSCIVFLCLINQNFCDWIDSTFNTYYFIHPNVTVSMFRARGYAGGIFCITSTGVLQLSVGLISCIYKILESRSKLLYTGMFIFLSFIITAVSRTGLIIVAVSLLFLIIESMRRRQFQFPKLAVSIIVLMIISFGVLSYLDAYDFLSVVFKRFKIIEHLGLYGGFFKAYFSGSTTVIPELSIETIVGIGMVSGTAGNGITINADGDYFRLYAALGLPISLILILYYIWGLMLRCSMRLMNGNLRWLSFTFLTIMIIGQFKEPLFYMMYYYVLYYVFIYFAEKDYRETMNT